MVLELLRECEGAPVVAEAAAVPTAAKYMVVGGRIVAADDGAAVAAALVKNGEGLQEDVVRAAELRLRELHSSMAAFGVPGPHNTVAKRGAHVSAALLAANRELGPVLGDSHPHLSFFRAFCASTAEDERRSEAPERGSAGPERALECCALWEHAVRCFQQDTASPSSAMEQQCRDFLCKCYTDSTPPRLDAAYALARASCDTKPDDAYLAYRAGVLALRLARSRPRGSERRASDFAVAAEHLRSALVRDCCYDDALVELVFLEQKERGDCGAARVVARTAIAHANATGAPCRWRDPWQRPEISSLAVRCVQPWYEPAAAPSVCAVLERAYAAIRSEAAQLLRTEKWPHADDDEDLAVSTAAGRAPEWRRFSLLRGGTVDPTVAARCPRTLEALQAIESVREAVRLGVGEAYFESVSPGTHLRARTGNTNLRLTAQLGLVAPRGTRLRVGDASAARATREWVEGECLVFDDSFEHESWYEAAADCDRLVLVAHFFHPDVPAQHRAAEVRTVLEAQERRKLTVRYGSLATESAIRNASYEQFGARV